MKRLGEVLSRSTVLVKLARKIQKVYHYFSFLDLPFELFSKKTDKLVICLLAPPRSGSTLTYQLLSSSIKCSSLRNISNLLYSTPILSEKVSSLLCKNLKTTYSSSQGFVNGFCGEAEGLKFWKYWLNQGLIEDNDSLNLEKLVKLKNKFEKFNNDVIVTGYLGHVFSIKEMEETFDNIIFVYLKRDTLSNAYSLLKLHKLGNYSVLPNNINKNCNEYEFVLNQIGEIHNRINSFSVKNMIAISYEDLCDNPKSLINQLSNKALQLGFNIQVNSSNIPMNFKKSVISPNKDENAKSLNRYIINKGN